MSRRVCISWALGCVAARVRGERDRAGVQHRKAVDQTFSGAVDLDDAIPVVPDFLK
jgi:hypothetical protein